MKARLVATQDSLKNPSSAPMVVVQGRGAPFLEQALHFFALPNRPIELIQPEDIAQILNREVILSEVRTLKATDVYSREYRREVGAWYDEFRNQLLESMEQSAPCQ